MASLLLLLLLLLLSSSSSDESEITMRLEALRSFGSAEACCVLSSSFLGSAAAPSTSITCTSLPLSSRISIVSVSPNEPSILPMSMASDASTGIATFSVPAGLMMSTEMMLTFWRSKSSSFCACFDVDG